MNTAQRTMTLVGMGLVAGATMGLTATAASAAPADSSVVVENHQGNDRGDQRGDRDNDRGDRGGRDNDRGDRGGRGNDRGHGRDNDRGHGRDHDRDNRWGHNNDRNRWGSDGRTRSYTVAYFDSKRACEAVGRVGERRGYWDDSDCERVGRSGFFALQAEYNGRHRNG